MLNRSLGSFMPPPYLDQHGEEDLGLRRGRPQFLAVRRYEELRKAWLSMSIPSRVSRRIEQTFDVGGWESM